MRILLDTSTILWLASDTRKLSSLARQLFEDSSNELCFSCISIWELGNKCSVGKLKIADGLDALVEALSRRFAPEWLGFSLADSLAGRELPLIHRDPFDRMLIAQARSRDLVLATPDRLIRQYDVATIW